MAISVYNITPARLAMIHLAGNKKKSMITICSMAITGLFFMVVATVLSCANPSEAADNSIMGEYQFSPIIEFNNKEYPELEWSRVQKNNPLTEELKEQILQINGVTSVECYLGNYVISDAFDGDREGIIGVPESGKELLENGIIEGNVEKNGRMEMETWKESFDEWNSAMTLMSEKRDRYAAGGRRWQCGRISRFLMGEK